jgi:hypothetical protein
MSIKCFLFGKKKEEAIPKSVSPITHTIGYELYTKDGGRSSRFYKYVTFDDRLKVREAVYAEINLIESKLNEAVANKQEFVNLSGTLIRVNDFIKVCFFEEETKE